MVVAIDVGGTKILCGRIINGRVTKKLLIEKVEKHNKKKFLNELEKGIKKIERKPSIICVGVPSIIENEKCLEPVNIKSLECLNLKKFLEKKFGSKVLIENDANCFALGEFYFGKAKKFSNVVCVTIGTGIGAGIIINKKLFTGRFHGAGEIGRIPFEKKDLEEFCSSKFFLKKGKEPKEFFLMAKKGNKSSIKIFEEFGKNLGKTLAIIINAYHPEAVVFGGKIIKSKKFFEKEMIKEAKKYCYKKIFRTTKILFSKNSDSSLLGATKISRQRSNLKKQI